MSSGSDDRYAKQSARVPTPKGFIQLSDVLFFHIKTEMVVDKEAAKLVDPSSIGFQKREKRISEWLAAHYRLPYITTVKTPGWKTNWIVVEDNDLWRLLRTHKYAMCAGCMQQCFTSSYEKAPIQHTSKNLHCERARDSPLIVEGVSFPTGKSSVFILTQVPGRGNSSSQGEALGMHYHMRNMARVDNEFDRSSRGLGGGASFALVAETETRKRSAPTTPARSTAMTTRNTPSKAKQTPNQNLNALFDDLENGVVNERRLKKKRSAGSTHNFSKDDSEISSSAGTNGNGQVLNGHRSATNGAILSHVTNGTNGTNGINGNDNRLPPPPSPPTAVDTSIALPSSNHIVQELPVAKTPFDLSRISAEHKERDIVSQLLETFEEHLQMLEDGADDDYEDDAHSTNPVIAQIINGYLTNPITSTTILPFALLDCITDDLWNTDDSISSHFRFLLSGEGPKLTLYNDKDIFPLSIVITNDVEEGWSTSIALEPHSTVASPGSEQSDIFSRLDRLDAQGLHFAQMCQVLVVYRALVYSITERVSSKLPMPQKSSMSLLVEHCFQKMRPDVSAATRLVGERLYFHVARWKK